MCDDLLTISTAVLIKREPFHHFVVPLPLKGEAQGAVKIPKKLSQSPNEPHSRGTIRTKGR